MAFSFLISGFFDFGWFEMIVLDIAWHYYFMAGFRYLALVAALASEADFVFIPEWPPEVEWPDVLCTKLKQVFF